MTTADPVVDQAAQPARRWHVSDGHLRGFSVDPPGFSTGEDVLPAPPTRDPRAAADALPPLWKRIVTGRSLGWRVRAVRRKTARSIVRWFERHPETRRAVQRGEPIRAVRAVIAARRTRDSDTGAVVRIPITGAIEVDADAGGTVLTDRVQINRPATATSPEMRVVDHPPLDDVSVPTVEIGGDILRLRGPGGGTAMEILPPVDVRQWSPRGFSPRFDLTVVSLAELLTRERERGSEVHRTSLRRVLAVRADDQATAPSATVAARIVGLAAWGVPIAGSVHSDVSALIGPELTDLIEHTEPRCLLDAVARERRSVELRTTALSCHGPRGRWSAIADELGVGIDTTPRVSVLMASNRPPDVIDAVRQIAGQRGVTVELIVGLHGDSFAPDVEQAIRELHPDAVVERFAAHRNLGQILNALTARATSHYVSKWDDDDWYDADHLRDLVLAMDHSGAPLVGKAAEFVYLESLDVTIRRFSSGSERRSQTVAGGTLMTTREHLSEIRWAEVPRQVDRRLIESMAAAGHWCYRTHGFGYVLRRAATGGDGHTWQADDTYFLRLSTDQRPGLDLGFAGISQGAR